MSSRVTKVSLVAEVNNYLNGMAAAAKKTRELGTETEKLAGQADALNTLGTGFLAVGTLAAAGSAIAIAKFAEFDSAISSVKAATQETSENMGLLREAALDAGASTVFTATEAAGAIEELGKAGLSTQEILDGGLSGALSLAAAGQLDVAEAAEITAISLKQFNLNGGDASRVADLLAAGAGKAVGDVDDLGNALNQVGLVANGAGQSIEDTTGVLSAFADAGLLGSDAGTSLKTAIIALQAPSARASAEMEKYAISVYNSDGSMKSFADIAGVLETQLGGLDDQTRNAALATIFGNDALRSANVLYEEGAAGIQKYIDQTNDSGYAAQVAADRLDNLKGDVEKLGGAFDTALIRSGSGANDLLRSMTQTATGLVDAFGNLPQPVLDSGLAVGAAAAAVGLVGGGSLLAIPKIAAFKTGLDTLGISGRRAAVGVGVATGAVAAVTLALGAYASQQADIANTGRELQDSLDQTTGALTDYSREIVKKKLNESGAFGNAERLGISQKELTDAVLEGGDAYAELTDKVAGFNTIAGAFDEGNAFVAGNLSGTLRDLSGSLDIAREGYQNMKAAGDTATDGLVDGLSEVESAARLSEVSLDDLKAAIEGFGSKQLDVNSATREFESAIDDLSASVETNTATLDVGTEAGRSNQAALDAIATSSLGLAAATLERTGSEDEAAAAVQRGRDELIKSLGQFGITGAAAEAYADQLGLIPSDVTTTARQIGFDEAIRKANLVADAIRNIPGQRDITINEVVRQTGAARGAVAAAYADGGAVRGPGTSLSDSIPARLSNGEHVVTAAEVAALGGQSAMYAWRRSLRAPTYVPSSPQGFAGGGAVGGSAALPDIYVQNPFTGEYLLAQMDGRAQNAVVSNNRQQSMTVMAGRRRDY